MARSIAVYDGAVIAPSGTDPYGNIKNAPAGTRVNRTSNSDLQVFFQRMMAEAGITPNNLPDNATNGFQLHESLLLLTQSKWLQNTPLDLNGQTYTFVTNYFLFYTNPTVASNTVTISVAGAFPGNEVYAITFASRGDVINFVPASTEATNVLTGLQSLTVQKTGILYIKIKYIGAGNFTAELYNDDAVGPLWTDWTDFGALGSGWVDGSINMAYKRDANGYVNLGGAVYNPVSTSPSSIITTLAAGFRPLRTQLFACARTLSPTYDTQTISIDTLGQVAIVGPVPGVINTNIFFDNIAFPTT